MLVQDSWEGQLPIAEYSSIFFEEGRKKARRTKDVGACLFVYVAAATATAASIEEEVGHLLLLLPCNSGADDDNVGRGAVVVMPSSSMVPCNNNNLLEKGFQCTECPPGVCTGSSSVTCTCISSTARK